MLSAQSLLFPTGPSLNNPRLKNPLVVPFARYPRRPCNGWKLRLFRSNPNTELTTMAVPANMELDPCGENMSFLVRVISHPSALLLKVALANLRSLVRFSITIVDMTGQPTTNGLSPRSARVILVDGQRHSPCLETTEVRRVALASMARWASRSASASHTRFQASGVISATSFAIPDGQCHFLPTYIDDRIHDVFE